MVAGACASEIPRPQGCVGIGAHYEISTDSPFHEPAQTATRLAEANHLLLERMFGRELQGPLPVLVFSDEKAYRRAGRDLGFDSVAGAYLVKQHFLVCRWDETSGPRRLAHEQVHYFVHEILPPVPAWLNEGLAVELAHSQQSAAEAELVESYDDLATIVSEEAALARTTGSERAAVEVADALTGLRESVAHVNSLVKALDARLDPLALRCPVARTAVLTEEDVRAAVEGLAVGGGARALYESEDAWRNYTVAGALARWAIETHPEWQTLAQVRPVPLDADAFLTWLRSKPDLVKLHERFPPITGTD
jgi:hypothetical protein